MFESNQFRVYLIKANGLQILRKEEHPINRHHIVAVGTSADKEDIQEIKNALNMEYTLGANRIKNHWVNRCIARLFSYYTSKLGCVTHLKGRQIQTTEWWSSERRYMPSK